MTGLALVAWLLATGTAPTPEASPATTPAPVVAATPAGTTERTEGEADYLVGPGDVVEVDVLGNDDLSRTTTVQTSGTITLPLLGDVPVAGLSARAIAERLRDLLGRDYLVNPQVEVKVKEYLSQFVSVVGEVQTPGRKPIKGKTRLIDALVEAGGFNARAAGEIVATRISGTFPNGSHTLTVRLGGALTPDNRRALETLLVSGDIISASPREYVTVEGEVQHPNRYPIDGQLSVTGVLSLAGGMTRFASSDVKVRRLDPQTGQVQIREVSLKAIRKGKEPDLVLMPNDVVTVPRRIF
jgi:polysaccharide export outer membrane protein